MNPTSRNRPTAAAAISSPSSRAESGEYFEIRRERERIAQFVKNGDLSEASKNNYKSLFGVNTFQQGD